MQKKTYLHASVNVKYSYSVFPFFIKIFSFYRANSKKIFYYWPLVY